MRFWDSSAILPLLVAEGASAEMLALRRADRSQVVWWGTPVECASALARLAREGSILPAALDQALARLDRLRRRWSEVQPAAEVRAAAIRLLRVHRLRAMDALQLAAAWVAAEGEAAALPLVTLDRRLGEAARLEGFAVLGSRPAPPETAKARRPGRSP